MTSKNNDQAVVALDESNNEHWSAELESMRSRGSYWLNNEIIRRNMYVNIASQDIHFIPFIKHFFNKKFSKALSICIGDGLHELGLLNQGIVENISVVEWSSENLDKFKKSCVTSNIDSSRYEIYESSVEELGKSLFLQRGYDVVFSISALHHISNLESVLSHIYSIIKPGGYFVVLEYVGNTRFQIGPDLVALCNDILESLPPAFVNKNKLPFKSPGLSSMLQLDPTEAQRPKDIIPLCDALFGASIYRRNYFGNIIHHLYPYFNTDRSNKGDDGFDAVISLLLRFEKLYVESSGCGSDFIFAIYKKEDVVG